MFRVSQPVQPLSRARVASCALINLAATPGLGSLIARRFWAGTGQLLLALAGFVLLVGWMFELFYREFRQLSDEPIPTTPIGWMWKWGLMCFAAAWVWSLVTSISLWRQAIADETGSRESAPPRLADLPKKNLENQ
jgi:hypothetical protein